MKLVVGLGNPGKKFEKTRHNVGFVVLDKLSERLEINGWTYSKNADAFYTSTQKNNEKVELLKPYTFMNESGLSVAYARKKHKIRREDIYVIHDDLDVAFGNYKIQLGKGPRDHGGLNSIYDKLGTKNFWHVRVGIDYRPQTPVNRLWLTGEDYVLQNFTLGEQGVLGKVIGELVDELIGTFGLKSN